MASETETPAEAEANETAASPESEAPAPDSAVAVEAKAAATAPKATPEPEARVVHVKERVGRVVSTKMQKTITVAVESLKPHPLYRKGMKWTTKFKAHDEADSCGEGDLVRIRETRPLSKTKRWQLVEIIQRAD